MTKIQYKTSKSIQSCSYCRLIDLLDGVGGDDELDGDPLL